MPQDTVHLVGRDCGTGEANAGLQTVQWEINSYPNGHGRHGQILLSSPAQNDPTSLGPSHPRLKLVAEKVTGIGSSAGSMRNINSIIIEGPDGHVASIRPFVVPLGNCGAGSYYLNGGLD